MSDQLSTYGNLVIHTALWYYPRSLRPWQRRRPLSTHLLLATSFEESAGVFLCTKATPAIAPSEGIQVRIRPFLPLFELLVVSSVIVCQILKLSVASQFEVKWLCDLPHSGRLIYLGFCFEGDVCEGTNFRGGVERGNYHIQGYLSFIWHKNPKVGCSRFLLKELLVHS